MDYTQFKNKFQRFPLIFSRDVIPQGEQQQAILNQLDRWQKRKLVVKLKRGMYLLNKNDRKVDPSRTFFANQLYGPSYVSLEYALGFYGLIPERVYDMTSVTTRKTMRLKNDEGVFVYQHIKPQAFRGFKMMVDESGLSFFIAEPEKAVVDFLYLNLHKFKAGDQNIFDASYRFQNIEGLNAERMMGLAKFFSVKKLLDITRLFCQFRKGNLQ